MFMRQNRATNGAPQPEEVASQDAKGQKAGKQLDPNPDIPDGGMDLRFSPKMLTCAQINEQHYQGGVSGSGPYATSYEEHILHIGKSPKDTLKGR